MTYARPHAADPGLLAAFLFATSLLASPALGDAVRLKASVRLPPAALEVRLGDIATLEGPEAEMHADLVIAQVVDPTAITEIPLALVREKLDEARVHWGRVNLSGRVVIVRPRGHAAAAAPLPMAGGRVAGAGRAEREAAKDDEHSAADLLQARTCRGAIARLLTRGMRVAPEDMRILFDPADREKLDAPDEGRTFEITPQGSLVSDRITMLVRVWAEARVIDTWRITLRTTLRCSVVTLARGVGRGDEITRQDVVEESRWLAPIAAASAGDLDAAVGGIASQRLEAGTVVQEKHVWRQSVVERGDRVMVRCLVGGVVISLEAEARADGAAGDTIQFRKLGERAEFAATVTRAGEAVIDLGHPGHQANTAAPRKESP